jgi:hypothetical protein
MSFARPVGARALLLAPIFVVILAACTQTAQAPSASPSAAPPSQPAESDSPSPSESPSPEPTSDPSPEPSESPIDVIEHELPMVGRVTEDDVDVRTHPLADAPLVTGENLAVPGEMPEVVLDTGHLVAVTLGPLVHDGESWYEIASVDGDDINFAFGWIPGRFLEPHPDAQGSFPVIETLHGQGDGGSLDVDVIVGTPVTVRYAALPMEGEDECDIEVTVTNTDGSEVVVVERELTEILIEEVTPFQVAELFQNDPGTVTVEFETDCTFAGSLLVPPS